MCDFKIGDIVKCVNLECGSTYIHMGVSYRVRDIEFDYGEYYLCLDSLEGDYIEGGWYWHRFVKVTECKDNPYDYFCNIQLLHGVKALKLTVCDSGHEIRIFNDLTPEGGKRIELWNVVTYHNDKCEIADENMRKAIECACEIYDMIFKA
jgi:hypothetical protein